MRLSDKEIKRRNNILYWLRKKGIRVFTKQRTVFFEYGGFPLTVVQICRLRDEFGFVVQYEI
jgi:hypothetical protein